jgi:hypothetical protein
VICFPSRSSKRAHCVRALLRRRTENVILATLNSRQRAQYFFGFQYCYVSNFAASRLWVEKPVLMSMATSFVPIGKGGGSDIHLSFGLIAPVMALKCHRTHRTNLLSYGSDSHSIPEMKTSNIALDRRRSRRTCFNILTRSSSRLGD